MTILAVILGVGAAVVVSCTRPQAPAEEQLAEAQPPVMPTTKPAMTLADGPRTVTPSGLTIIETKAGDGPASKAGDNVEVHYLGRLYTGGDKFDSSYDRGSPLPFKLGAHEVIAGFDEGATGLKLGGKRELLIPPNLGYGDNGAGSSIPPGATLVFDIEMMKIN